MNMPAPSPSLSARLAQPLLNPACAEQSNKRRIAEIPDKLSKNLEEKSRQARGEADNHENGE
jgi:hypothetical protein